MTVEEEPSAVAAAATEQNSGTTAQSTVYIRNINEKVKLPALKTSLKNLFAQFGQVLDVIAHRNVKMRGQAFVVFSKPEEAVKAIKEVQGFPIYGQPMNLAFSRSKSYAVAEMEGNLEDYKKEWKEWREKVKHTTTTTTTTGPKRKAEVDLGSSSNKMHRSNNVLYPALATGPQLVDDYLPPNNILFLQQLPPGTTEVLLVEVFQAFMGFREVRLVPSRPDIAFVEYDTEMQASIAKDNAQGMEIIQGGGPIKITYARK